MINTMNTEVEMGNGKNGVDALRSDTKARSINQANSDEFAPQAERNTRKKVGRNEPCPCASGKKYKKCHGRAQAPKLVGKSFNRLDEHKATTLDGSSPSRELVAEFVVYISHRYREMELNLWSNLEEVVERIDNLHDSFSGTFWKVWFDLATRKVLDVKKIRSIPFKACRLYFADEPPTHTPELPENTVEFQDIIDPEPMAKAQFWFDHPNNRNILEECQRELVGANSASKGKIKGYRRLRAIPHVIDIALVNPDLVGPDGTEPEAGKIHLVKFNLTTWKVLSFKEMPRGVEAMAEEMERDPITGYVHIMELDEDIPEEATRDLAGMQRFLEDPARNTLFWGLIECLKDAMIEKAA